MGQINTIRGDKKTKKQPNKYMVSVSFDLYASDHQEACYKLADYLENSLNSKSKKECPRMYFEAGLLKGKYDLEDGVDILV